MEGTDIPAIDQVDSPPDGTAHVEVDWEAFCATHLEALYRHGRRCCHRFGLDPGVGPDVAHDAIRDSLGRIIRGTSDKDVLRYLHAAIRNKASDRSRRHEHQKRHTGEPAPDESPDAMLDGLRWAQGDAARSPDLDTRRGLRAAVLARTHLGAHVERGQDAASEMVEVAWATQIEGLTLRELVEAQGGDGPDERTRERLKKRGQRGGWMIEGWVHALLRHQPARAGWDPRRLAHWRRGHEAAQRFAREQDWEALDVG